MIITFNIKGESHTHSPFLLYQIPSRSPIHVLLPDVVVDINFVSGCTTKKYYVAIAIRQ